MSSLVSKHNTQ